MPTKSLKHDLGCVWATYYRSLLSKYIQHVGECEGVDFLSDGHGPPGNRLFTRDEWEDLREISDETL